VLKNKASVPVVLLVAGLFAWLYAEALFGGGLFVFRDAGHYYYPLLQFIRGEWLAGRVPLWNPYENLGVPLAGNATASVFYPGTLILLLPVGFATAYQAYILAHSLLAAWAAYRLARHWQASVEGAAIAAVSYAFCGNVLFQYANVVFLVGAAWLPLAVLTADRMLVTRGPKWALLFGATLALMTLGGDPQMAYDACLIAGMEALWLWWWRRSPPLPSRPTASVPRWKTLGRSHPVLLGLAVAMGLALAAIQVFPSVEFSRRSGRTVSNVPRTIYELPRHLSNARAASESVGYWSDGLTCRRLEPGSHHEDVYQFSVGPWRLAEYLWPNIGGRQFPIHHRWFDSIPAEGRVWVPSLYMGLLPLVLGLATMRFRRTDARTSWLSWLVVLSVMASFGWYGPAWLFSEIRGLVQGHNAEPAFVGSPFGGLYWLMTVVLPGYIYFRYPAKLLVLAALGLSMLAAAGWDRVLQGSDDRTRRGLLGASGASLVGLILFGALQPWWSDWLQQARPSGAFGPLDVAGATGDVTIALSQTALLALVFWWLLGRARRGARWAALTALLLLLLDLGIANHWMVACAPRDCLESPSKLAAALQEHDAQHGDGQPYRIYRETAWLPVAWQHRGALSRLSELARWEHDTLFPKHNLTDRMALAEVYGTMMPCDYEGFLDSIKRDGELRTIGVRYQVLRGDQEPPGDDAVRLAAVPGDGVLWYDPRSAALAEIVHSDDSRVKPIQMGESCRVTRYEPSLVEIAARLGSPGLVILRDQFYPGWRLEVETAGQGWCEVPIVRTDQVMRGAWLPAGEHRLVYRYRPKSILWGAMLSGFAWIGLAVAAIAGCQGRSGPAQTSRHRFSRPPGEG
jgi:hypothetical protein